MSTNFPGGRDALRSRAVGIVRQALEETHRARAAEDGLAGELVDVAERFDLPLSAVLAWLHFTAPATRPLSAAMFAAHCDRPGV